MLKYIKRVSITGLLAITILCSSCAIRGNFKGLYSYYKTTKKESPEIMQKSNNVDSICNSNSLRLNPKILVVNGTSLKQCLAKKKKALIYYWAPRCRSQMCFPPEIVQSTCDSKKIELYIVAEYYDSENMKINYNIKRPIYGIDTEYYKTSLTTKYTRKFLFDIDSSLDFSKIKLGDRYLYFENGKFIKSYESVYDVEK